MKKVIVYKDKNGIEASYNFDTDTNTVYVDELIFKDRRGRLNCHMWSPNSQALQRMAKIIGLNPNWIQDKKGEFVHYDIVRSYRDKAVRAGCVEVDRYLIVALVKAYREYLNNGESNE